MKVQKLFLSILLVFAIMATSLPMLGSIPAEAAYTPAPSSLDRYVTPIGAGTKDGSNWENAMDGNGNNLATIWRNMNASGALYFGSGTYTFTSGIGTLNSSTSGPSASAMKRLIGVDTGSGLPMIECAGNTFMDIPASTCNIWLQDFKVNNVYNGINLKGKNKNIRIYNVDVSNAKNGNGGYGIWLAGGLSSTDPLSAATNDVIIKDCDVSNCAKGLLRLQNGVYNVRVFNSTFDNGGAAVFSTFTTPWSIGIRSESTGTAADGAIRNHGIVFSDCVVKNVYQGATGGTGVDIGNTTYDVTFVRTRFMDNNGTGVEEKSGSATFIDCEFLRNRRNIYFNGPGESTSLLYRTLNAYPLEVGMEIDINAQVEAYSSTLHNSQIKNKGYLKLVNSIVSATSDYTSLYTADAGTAEKYNTVEYKAGSTSDTLDPRYINPSNIWDGEGNDFDSAAYGTAKGFYYRGAEIPSSTQPQPAGFIKTKTEAETSLKYSETVTGNVYYVTPTGAGTKDGTSWGNAMEGNKVGGLQAAWDRMTQTVTRSVYIGSGNYNIEQELMITNGGTSIKDMRSLVGVDTGAGLPVFTGNFSLTNQTGGPLITLTDNVNYVWIQDLKINRYNQAIQAIQRHKGLRIYNVDTELTRIAMQFEGLNDDTAPENGSKDTIIMDCDQKNYTIRGIRFRYGNSLARIINCKSDAGSEANWNASNFPMGFTVGNNDARSKVKDKGFVFIECEGSNAWQEDATYWNGDGFNSELCASNLVYFACKTYNNTDGGWDDKAYNPTLIDCMGSRNKRTFRFWSEGSAVLYNCLSAHTKVYGGHALGLWTGGATAKTEVFNSTLHNSAEAEISAENGATIRLYDCILSSDTNKILTSGNVELYDTAVYTPSTGVNPSYVNGSNKFWLGEGDDFNSTVYGSVYKAAHGKTKGYIYLGIYKGVSGLTFPVMKTILMRKLDETAGAIGSDYSPHTWTVFVTARTNALAVRDSNTANQDIVDEAVSTLMRDYYGLTGKAGKPFEIINAGTINRTGGLKATATINPSVSATHEGVEVIVFQLKKGTTPISMVAMEQDITSQRTLTTYFNVQDPADINYVIIVYVLDSFSSDPSSVPENLAAPVDIK